MGFLLCEDPHIESNYFSCEFAEIEGKKTEQID
jgi:hypothetical protein